VLPEVVWMSQASAEVYEPGEREVCISIRDPAAPLPGLSPRFIAVLSLEFQDDPEPGWEDRGRSITEAQADQVIEFVERHAAAVGSSSTAWSASHARRASPRDCWSPTGGGPSPTGSSIQGCINASWAPALAGSGRGIARKPPTAAAVTMESVEAWR
jgi:hypothetical protein